MLKVTPDTNILVSAVISKGNEFELLRLAHIGRIKVILSLQILKEFKDVISRKKFGFSDEKINRILKSIVNISAIVMPSNRIDLIKEDPADNKILECAETGKADYIVSGDGHLLKLKKYKGIEIVKTSNILKKIN